ncbi:MAG: hypothetical protein FJX29_15285 [Alphaproteobacteria bacterium]|nr:hypothetical protein [Alphaproteobacteria bacterium]
MEDTSARIAMIEDEIALVQEQLESCEKFIFGARIAVTGGLIWAGLIVLGFVRLDALSLTMIVTCVIGGFVFWGSNKATQEQAQTQLAGLRKRHKALIETLDLRDVTLH